MTFKPRHQNPTQHGTDDAGPDVIQPNIKIRTRIVGTPVEGGESLQKLAEDLQYSYSTNINHFVERNRQQLALSGHDQQRARMNLPGMDVTYHHLFGHETLEMTAYVGTQVEKVEGGDQPDTQENLDGYIYMLFLYDKPGLLSPIADVTLKLNGQPLLTAEPMVDGPYGHSSNWPSFGVGSTAYIAMFGETALRCESLEGAINPLLVSKFGTPINKVRGKRQEAPGVQAVQNSPYSDSTFINAHDDIFGYLPFKPQDATFFPAFPYAFDLDPGHGAPMIEHDADIQIQYAACDQWKDPKKSPLNWNGMNVVEGSTTYVGLCSLYIAAEFYDRTTNTKRAVKIPWQSVGKAGVDITKSKAFIVKDKPLFWTGANSDVAAPNPPARMLFDLTPGVSSGDNRCALGDGAATTITGGGAGTPGPGGISRKVHINGDITQASSWSFDNW